MINSIETYIVDSFTDKPFKGNPAGVCILKSKLQDQQMLSIAKELGLSETAFVTKTDLLNTYNIPFFSPKMEIPPCEHATLASSKVLFEKDTSLTKIHFINSQNLDLIIKRDGKNILMKFPVYDTKPQEVPRELLNALGLNKVIASVFNEETEILLLEIEDSQVLANLTPDFESLKHSHKAINGVLVTAISKQTNYDFESRYFWPWSGINEDPVTGATHTFLAKYWSKQLNKTKMNSYQCSERTGFMEVELISNEKLIIKSMAQIILKGELTI